MKYVPLHVHSEFSLLEASARHGALIEKAKNDGMESIAITDNGNMYGAVEFYQKCLKEEIKPIIGVDAYIAPNGRHNKRANVDETRYRVVLLAKNNIGYQNLLKMVSQSYLEGFYYKPRVDDELLKKYGEGLIGLSGNMYGEIPMAILMNKTDEELGGIIEKYEGYFGKGNFYLEVQHHPTIGDQDVVNNKLYELGKMFDVAVVATPNSFYVDRADAQAHDVLTCIPFNRKVNDPSRKSMIHEDYSFKTKSEMIAAFKDHPEAIENTVKIADQCHIELEFGVNKLPYFEVPKEHTEDSFLRELCFIGLVERYGGEIKDGEWIVDEEKVLITSQAGEFKKKEILERLEYELGIIGKTGYGSYFLITADLIVWAKEQGIVVGPGRGSAAGSLVAYVTKITNLDPLFYDLLFERFLNPERISMPDIDTDFSDIRRGEVIKYVEQKYGKECVSQIITFGTMAARAAIRDVGRVLDVDYGYCDKLAKLVPTFTKLQKALDEVKEFKDEYNKNPEAKKLIDVAINLEGVSRHNSVHACGVLITKDPLDEYTPIQYASGGDENAVSQYSSHPIEDLGLLKMDFLGLKNLTIIENTLEAVEKIHGLKIDIDTIPLDNEDSYILLQKGNTTGVFQLESAGMKRYLKMLKPSNMEDIIAMVALYRPGPMDLIPDYISNKLGETQPTYLHPKLEPILKKTQGIAIYQEQLMQIARDLAGFSLGEADVLRKAVGKKILKLLEEQKLKFIKGCGDNDISKDIATKIFAFMEPFARYGFNRSHAACYAYVAYQTAYLKANYPAEFMAALMTCDLGDNERLAIEINECSSMGIQVMPPDVNESYSRFTVVAESLETDNSRIRFGLAGIKGVGEKVTHVIIQERKENGPFKSLEDFLSRLDPKSCNKRLVESLIKSGSFDRFGDRQTLLHNIERLLKFCRDSYDERESQQDSLFGETSAISSQLILEESVETEKRVMLVWEKEMLGLYLSEHPFKDYYEELSGYIVTAAKLKKYEKQQIRVAGIITGMKKIITKKGKEMLFVTLEDTTGMLEVIVFPETYTETKNMWEVDGLVIVSGELSKRDEEKKVICNEVKHLNQDVVKFIVENLKKVKDVPTKPEGQEENNVYIFFNKMIGSEAVTELTDIFKEHAGDQKVYLAIPLDDTRFKKIETNYKIDFSSAELQNRLKTIDSIKMVRIM